MRLINLLLFIFIASYSKGQSVGVNNPAPHVSSVLDVQSNNKGMLIPRMTKMNRNAIAAPANGLMVYQTGPDSTGFYYYHNQWRYLNYDSMLPPSAMLLSNTYPNARLENNNFTYKGKLNIPGATLTQVLPVANNVWESIDSSVVGYPPNGAADFYSIWVDSVFYLAGGFSSNSEGIDFYKFNPISKQWQAAGISTRMPTAAAQSRVGNKWVFWGGYYNPGNNNALPAFLFDLTTNTLSQSALPNDSARGNLIAATVGNNVYFWGGSGVPNLSYMYNTGYYYNVVNNTWTKMNNTGSPIGRMHAGAVAAGSDIVIWGGYNPNGGGFLNNGAIYRTLSNTWVTLSSTNAPPASIDPAMAYYNNNVYIIAGGQARRLNLATNTWTTLAAPPYTFNGQKFAYDGNGKILVFGGARYFSSGAPTATGYIYDIATNSYTILTSNGAPQARAGHTLCSNGNGSWLVWGGSTNTSSGLPPATNTCLKSGALFYKNATNISVTLPVGDLFLYEKN